MSDQQQQQPAPPANAAEAATRLTTLSADKTWSDNLLAGDVAATKEFRDLTALVASGDVVDRAMSGLLPSGIPTSEERTMRGTAEMLRSIGIRDEVIKQTLNDQEVTQAEHDATRHWKARVTSDQNWVQRYLKGDIECREKMTLADIILSSPIKEATA